MPAPELTRAHSFGRSPAARRPLQGRRLELRQPLDSGRGSTVVSGNHRVGVCWVCKGARKPAARWIWLEAGCADTPSSLARAWITIALRLHGVAVPDDLKPLAGPGSPDLMVVALEALGAPGGNYGLLKTEVARMKIKRQRFLSSGRRRTAGRLCRLGRPALAPQRARRSFARGGAQSLVLLRRSGAAHSARRARVRAGRSRSKSSAQAESGGVRSEHLHQHRCFGGCGGL